MDIFIKSIMHELPELGHGASRSFDWLTRVSDMPVSRNRVHGFFHFHPPFCLDRQTHFCCGDSGGRTIMAISYLHGT